VSGGVGGVLGVGVGVGGCGGVGGGGGGAINYCVRVKDSWDLAIATWSSSSQLSGLKCVFGS